MIFLKGIIYLILGIISFFSILSDHDKSSETDQYEEIINDYLESNDGSSTDDYTEADAGSSEYGYTEADSESSDYEYTDYYDDFDDKYYFYNAHHGSADTPDGTTVVVTIFADDKDYAWDPDSDLDNATKSDVNQYLRVAADYLEGVVASYGKTANFITNFETYPDLKYTASFDQQMTKTDDVDYPAWEYIDDNIDMEAIKTKYNADNVIFFMVFNTDEKNSAVTCTRNWYEGMEYPYEIVYLYNFDYDCINGPAVYAHEMLHAFGAPDLYTEDEFYRIDSTVISYVDRYLPNEIMYTCTDLDSYEYTYDRVTNEVTDLTAYYVGLTDHSEVYDEFCLSGNQHFDE